MTAMNDLDSLKKSTDLWREKCYRLEDENTELKRQLESLQREYMEASEYLLKLEKKAEQMANIILPQQP